MNNIKDHSYIGESLKYVIDEQKVGNSEFNELFQEQELINDIIHEIVQLRRDKNISQSQLAEITNTTQPLISRLEGMKDSRVPSLKLLSKLAKGLGKKIKISFEDLPDHTLATYK